MNVLENETNVRVPFGRCGEKSSVFSKDFLRTQHDTSKTWNSKQASIMMFACATSSVI